MSINSSAWIRDYSSSEAIYGKKNKEQNCRLARLLARLKTNY